jgi:hypothetical protein
MLAILIAAWRDLSATGKTIVAVVILLAGAGLLGLAMWLGYNLDWLPGVLGMGLMVPPPPKLARETTYELLGQHPGRCGYCGSVFTAPHCPNCGAQRTAAVSAAKPKIPVRPAPNNPTELR